MTEKKRGMVVNLGKIIVFALLVALNKSMKSVYTRILCKFTLYMGYNEDQSVYEKIEKKIIIQFIESKIKISIIKGFMADATYNRR